MVVGYTATAAGADAVAVGARLARATGARLALVTVLPRRGVVVPLEVGYENVVAGEAQRWLDEAAAGVADVPASGTVWHAESAAEGLREVAGELGASFLVVGAADGSIRGRVGLGSVTNQLVHSAEVPVVLAPAGSAEERAPLRRVTVGVGTRPGADALLRATASLASAASVPVRLVSLVALDLPRTVDSSVARLATSAHAQELLARVHDALPDGLEVEEVTAQGESVAAVVETLSWEPGEVVLVGSSRLARRRRTFLGSTAARMLRALPVPMIVVPRGPKESRR